MKRREFITGLGGAAAWPFATLAQQPERMRQIAFLMNTVETDGETRRRLSAFRRGLNELGWIEGKTFGLKPAGVAATPNEFDPMPGNLFSWHRMFL